MKELNFDQMEDVYAGGAAACISQVAGGMGVLWTLAAIGSFAIGPIGWITLGFSAVSLISGVIADPTACDT